MIKVNKIPAKLPAIGTAVPGTVKTRISTQTDPFKKMFLNPQVLTGKLCYSLSDGLVKGEVFQCLSKSTKSFAICNFLIRKMFVLSR